MFRTLTGDVSATANIRVQEIDERLKQVTDDDGGDEAHTLVLGVNHVPSLGDCFHLSIHFKHCILCSIIFQAIEAFL